MIGHCKELLGRWQRGGVILSPRDLSDEQMTRVAESAKSVGAKVYLDPQFYSPTSDHQRLTSHDFWPNDYESTKFWTNASIRGFLKSLKTKNEALGSDEVILPSALTHAIDDTWAERAEMLINQSAKAGIERGAMLMTLALTSDVIRNDEAVQELLEICRGWNIGGVYLICEHPNGAYLVQDAAWLSNALELAAGLRLQNKRVVAGYCNHQMLALALCSTNAIACGTWMNVRSFSIARFRAPEDDEIRRKSSWYYCPRALSEYKLPALDRAHSRGILNKMKAPNEFGASDARLLFSGVQPTTVDFTESHAFRHYLNCLNCQVLRSRWTTFDETHDKYANLLNVAERLLNEFHELRIDGLVRDFRACVDANRTAVARLRETRGAMLKRKWSIM